MAEPSTRARITDLDRFRRHVLAHPLATGIESDEVAAYLAHVPFRRFPGVVYGEHAAGPRIQPRGGFPRFESQLGLTRKLDAAGADFIPLTIDSYTRQNQYETASELLLRSEEEGKDYLNGYPLVNHGFEVTRELYEGLDKPVSLRHGTPDARLLAEVALASGIVEIEGGGICYCIPYSEGFPLDRCLLYWQYVDRLCAVMSSPGRIVHRESFGPLTATLVPPAIAIAVEVAEALLAAEQGVRSFAVSFGQTGSMVQDLATARVLRALVREYLDRFGFEDVRTYLVYHQWMGQFSQERPKAAALIAGSAVVGQLVGADKIVAKTVDEALGIPRAEVNAEAVDVVGYIFRVFQSAGELTSPVVEEESALIMSESRSILDAIVNLPGESFWQSVYEAFQRGWIDIPFSPHGDNANRLVSIRDARSSIRIARPGSVPLAPADLERERVLLDESGRRFGKTYLQLLADIDMMARS